MKKKAKGHADEALRRFYEKRSSLSSNDRLEAVHISFPKPRRLVALRLEEETIAALRRLASQKGLNYSTLMRMWITERLAHELTSRASRP